MVHPNIVRLYDAIETQRQIYLVMEAVEGQSLASIVKVRPMRRYGRERECARVMLQVMSAVGYMHGLEIYHRDIKMENILIEERTGEVKLIDFGFSCQSKDKLKIFCGTPNYMSPEIVCKREYFGGPADVWACGIVLYTLLTGSFPFKSLTTEKELFRKINRAIVNFTAPGCPQDLSFEAKDLIKGMLSAEPQDRLTAA
jgi:MAP/microtubule affinity-regulating kinase